MPWEYTVLTIQSGKEQLWLSYSAADAVDDEHRPTGAYGATLGELGGKDWELVAVTHTVDAGGSHLERLYFKRPHDPARSVRD